jgi:plastocyanin
MHFSTVVALFAAVAAASARLINVQVGLNGSLTYTPSSVVAAEGDIVAFTFMAKNHTLTQSTFPSPCTNITNPMTGIDTGFVPVPPNATSFQQFRFTVNNASVPLWFYCRQTGHCQKGMVFAINPTATHSFAAFQAAAMASNSSGSTTTTSTGGSGDAGTATVPVTSSNSPTVASTPSATPSSGAVRLAGSTAGLLTLVGLLAGMTL